MTDTNHPARRLRHGDRPTEPLTFEDAAANKAAEEGGLPDLPEPDHSLDCGTLPFWNEDDMNEYALVAITADRASRQVANKAEVEPVAIDRDAVRDAVADSMVDLYHCGRVWSAWSYGTMDESDFSPAAEDDDILDNITDAAIAAMGQLATPPATTGASTAEHEEILTLHRQLAAEKLRADQGWERAEAKSRECINLRERMASSVGARTVLTAERINQILDEVNPSYWDVPMGATFDFARAIIGEVAAQAGQAAASGEQLEWSHDLQKRLIAAGEDFDEDEYAGQLIAEAACLLAALTGVPASTPGESQEGAAA